jgi:hypothetical protein
LDFSIETGLMQLSERRPPSWMMFSFFVLF